MSDEDLAAIDAATQAAVTRLATTPYSGCRKTLDTALTNLDYYTQQSTFSLGGARYWATQARLELDQLLKALVAAEAVSGGKQ